ncbi:hypothetical protein C1H46_013486 [Malus baccata]|uniref:Uncharacterized protein n=1 Tax=Malus baccata TaxID=106549 RepID=A0A540MQ76_MALBA|nr:hypothetical protein C1H46_013486 [Malus baccata]
MAEDDLPTKAAVAEENNVYTKDGTVDFRGNPAKRNETGTWKACPFILGNECCERLAYYGMSSNLVIYFKSQLNQTSAATAKNNSNWGGTCYLTPLLGALLADSYLGRYKTIASFSLIYIIGMTLLTMSASVPGMKPTSVAMAIAVLIFFSGTRLYRNQKPGGSPLTRIIQVIVASIRNYKVKVPEDKSLLYETADAESSIQGSRKLDHTNEFRFFDKAAVEVQGDQIKDSKSPWRLSTVTQVEELKSIIRLLPIWATGIIFAAACSQMSNFFVLQGTLMDIRVGRSSFEIPAASLSIFDILSVIFWVPIYDRIIVPAARKYTGHKNGLTTLQRMGIGLFISIFSMVCAAVLELIRLRSVRQNNYYTYEHMPMSVFWQVPQYFLIGAAEVFKVIGQLEFFYDQAPDAMRSLCSALSLSTIALGNYFNSILVTIVTKMTTKNGNPEWIPNNLNYGHLDYFFWLLAVLSVLNLGVYLFIAKWYTYKKTVGTLR